ncbi:TPA: hypothetical protein DDW35_00175 [Candidatus Sumerlaeota bacterium]|jgi:SAM-dependent methyltransferase|nr:hypothetical protein [Candidatus Sumerlaeota bacterium]
MPPSKIPPSVPIFSRMGAVYHLLADEKERTVQEQPLLLEIAAQAQQATGCNCVLDLACGTGLHARLLGQAGYSVLALDFSDSMLSQAQSLRNPRCVQYGKADLLQPLPVENPAALTLLMGNTLSVFPERRQLEAVFCNAAAATLAGGTIFCQTLNYERIRRFGSVLSVRHGRIDRHETVVTKTLFVLQNGRVLLNISACQGGKNSEWASFSECQTLTPLVPKEIIRAAKKAGLKLVADYGGDDKSPFDPERSGTYLSVFEKCVLTSR